MIYYYRPTYSGADRGGGVSLNLDPPPSPPPFAHDVVFLTLGPKLAPFFVCRPKLESPFKNHASAPGIELTRQAYVILKTERVESEVCMWYPIAVMQIYSDLSKHVR